MWKIVFMYDFPLPCSMWHQHNITCPWEQAHLRNMSEVCRLLLIFDVLSILLDIYKESAKVHNDAYHEYVI